eukprot:767438-Hanusia_phi.AAC.4
MDKDRERSRGKAKEWWVRQLGKGMYDKGQGYWLRIEPDEGKNKERGRGTDARREMSEQEQVKKSQSQCCDTIGDKRRGG